MNKIVTLIVSLVIIVGLSSCSKDKNQNAELFVYLQDAPAPSYDKIKVELKGVSVYSQSAGQWVTLNVSNGVFDLLTLDGSHPAFLGSIKLSGGNISQLQLLIGNQNNVTVSGINYPLILDAADLDKLKVKMDHSLNNGTSNKLTIDFKAAESIDNSGNLYKLKASLKIEVKEM